MSHCISLVLENVRRIKRAELVVCPQSRTVVVGRNNAGKTTLLDMASRAIWSLPAPFDDSHRAFHTSWYRRTGEHRERPRAEVSIPTAVLDAALFGGNDAHFVFELFGQHLETRVSNDTDSNSKLVTVRCDLLMGGEKFCFLKPEQALGADLWADHMLSVATQLLEESEWQNPLQAGVTMQGPLPARIAYERNTPLSRAIDRLCRRVIYLHAARTPDFQAASSLSKFSQANLLSMSSLLLSLHSADHRHLKSIGVAMSLLFPEVEELKLVDHPRGVVPAIRFGDGSVEHAGNLGFGFQNALHLITVLTACPDRAIVFVDEPEKGLNQSVQRDLGAVLETVRPDVSLVVATQSEALCRGFSSETKIVLAEANEGASRIGHLNISEQVDDMRRLAAAMGLDPLFLSEGGKIVYVEGHSDEAIIERWMRLQFPGEHEKYQVVALGGCGKLGEEFVKPILVAYQPRVFVLLDSDRRSGDEPTSPDIGRLARWLDLRRIAHHVLLKREIENYVGPDRIAEVAGIHPSALRGAPGHEDWFDIKAAFKVHRGFPYDERHLTVGAFDLLDATAQRNLFSTETEAIVHKVRQFLRG